MPSMIGMFDADGNQFYVERADYQARVLPELLAAASDDAESLAQIIHASLAEDFNEEALMAARRLFELDENRERAVTLLSAALVKTLWFDEAEARLKKFIETHTQSTRAMSYLANVYQAMGEPKKARETLWKSLEIEPNQDYGLDLWGDIHLQDDGAATFYKAMERAATIKESWRPQIWLARRHLEQDEINEALKIYRDVIERVPNDARALEMVAGDLTSNGFATETAQLILPLYEPQKHGAETGFHLIQTCIELNDMQTAARLCDAVEQFNRVDLRQRLAMLRDQIMRAERGW